MGSSEIRTELIEYREGADAFEGNAAYEADAAARRPCVLVGHDWSGVGVDASVPRRGLRSGRRGLRV